jgi:hypothetical protein
MTAAERDQDVTDLERVCRMFGEVAELVMVDWAIERGYTLVSSGRIFIGSVEQEARRLVAREPALLAQYAPLAPDLMRRTIRADIESLLVKKLDDSAVPYLAPR